MKEKKTHTRTPYVYNSLQFQSVMHVIKWMRTAKSHKIHRTPLIHPYTLTACTLYPLCGCVCVGSCVYKHFTEYNNKGMCKLQTGIQVIALQCAINAFFFVVCFCLYAWHFSFGGIYLVFR